jgi:DNA topoisomerase-1
MRTDFAILSEEAIQEAQAWVLQAHGEKYVQSKLPKVTKPKDPKAIPQAQEAHEAIRPTHFEVVDLPGDWTPTDKKIYSLIWKRAVQSTMTAAKGDSLTLLTQIADFEWSSSWKRTTFDGWQILGKAVNIDSESDDEIPSDTIWKAASSIKVGTPLKWVSLTAEPKRTKASARFTEATLIRELERRGIGRPSTFASLVETLFDKTYIDKQDIPGSKAQQTTLTTTPNTWPPTTTLTQISLGAEKQKLVPTPLGESVLNFCVKEFPQLFAYEFTAQMERRLDNVSKGDEQWKAICRDTWTSYRDDHKRLSDRASAPSQSEKVNDFGDGFKAVMSKSGPLLVQESKGKSKEEKPTFYTLPKDTDITKITKEEALEFIRALEAERRIGEFDGNAIIKKKGPYGEYLESGPYKVPFIEEDSMETILAKFTVKKESASKLTRVGPYIFTVGQYGPYMYKDLKKKNFVSVPSTIDPKRLSVAEADALYKLKPKLK